MRICCYSLLIHCKLNIFETFTVRQMISQIRWFHLKLWERNTHFWLFSVILYSQWQGLGAMTFCHNLFCLLAWFFTACLNDAWLIFCVGQKQVFYPQVCQSNVLNSATNLKNTQNCWSQTVEKCPYQPWSLRSAQDIPSLVTLQKEFFFSS